jgi:hypothetical protein
MSRLRFQAGWAAVVVSCVMASALQASQYTEIQNNAFDGVNDATYVSHVLDWHSNDVTGFNILTLIEDTGTVPGFTGNVMLHLSSTFQDYNQTLQSPPRAYVAGGILDLTFDYSSDGTTWTSHQLRGSVSQGSVEITSTSPTLSTLTGIFHFNSNDPVLGVENLPSSNNWPAPGQSTAVALSFAIGADLSAYKNDPLAWDVNIPETPGVIFDTQFSLFPEERPIPEPAGLLLLLVGGLLAFHRRSRG